MTLKLIFMGTPEFALPTLKSLAESHHEILAVYTQPPRPAGRGNQLRPTPVHAFAETQALTVHTPVSLKAPDVLRQFQDYRADAAIVAAYGLLLPQGVLEGTRLGCINVHPSLLPRWRGAAPIQRTVMAGDTETAIVIMQMNAGLDTGDMLMVQRYPVNKDMNAGELHDRLAAEAGPMVLETLDGLQNGSITPVKQPEQGVTYARKITKEECRIHWNASAFSLHNHIRGLSPHPGAHFVHNGETIKVLRSELVAGESQQSPGTVIDHRLGIACSEGMLRLLTLQRPGKKPMEAEELLRGYPIPAGAVLS